MGVKIFQWKGAWWLDINHKGRRKRKRIGVGEPGKKAAKAAAAKIQAKLALGEFQLKEEKVPTLREYAASWLKTYVAVACKPRTQELYEAMLRLHVLPELGDVLLNEISREQIRRLLAAKAEAGLSRGSLQNILAPLRELLNHAVEDGLIPTNPAARLGRRLARLRGEDEGRRVEILTEPELAHLLATAETEYPDYRDLITTVAWTGLREGEAFGLQWGDVDFYGGFLEVRRTVSYRKGQLLIGSPKSGKSRRVDLPQALVLRLADRYEVTKAEAAFGGKEPVPWIFPNRAGRPLDTTNFLSRVWYPLLTKAGLRRVPFHTLRHTYASLLIMRGENLAYIKDQLGHSSIQVTVDLYGHLIPGANRGAVDALANATGRHLSATNKKRDQSPPLQPRDFPGAGEWTRTTDQLITNQLLYR